MSNRTQIILTPYDNALAGKITADSGDLLIELDSTISAFSVYLPDLMAAGDRTYIFKNFGINDVTLYTIHGQIIDFSDIKSHVMKYKDCYMLMSNLADKWVSINSTAVWG